MRWGGVGGVRWGGVGGGLGWGGVGGWFGAWDLGWGLGFGKIQSLGVRGGVASSSFSLGPGVQIVGCGYESGIDRVDVATSRWGVHCRVPSSSLVVVFK